MTHPTLGCKALDSWGFTEPTVRHLWNWVDDSDGVSHFVAAIERPLLEKIARLEATVRYLQEELIHPLAPK